MKIINELSTTVTSELESNTEAAWEWFSARYYEQQAEQGADELLVRIRQRFQLAELVAGSQSYRLYGGKRGQEATYGLTILWWALLLKQVMGWSYRQSCREIRTNTLCRWFVGYPLRQKTLSYVTLQRFARWVNENQPRHFFNAIVQQIGADFPDEASQRQVGDTFALLANVAPQSRTAMLRAACRRVLRIWQAVDREAVVRLGEFDLGALLGSEQEIPEERLAKSQRDEREAATALAADLCGWRVWQRVATLAKQRTPEFLLLEKWLGLLAKLLRDEFVFEPNADGTELTVRPCSEKERGSFVLGSTIDPEATFRKHGEKNQLGYNIQVAASEHFIHEIFAQTGATGDASGVALLIAHQKEQLGRVPSKLIYDRAAGSPKIFHDVAQASDGKTQLVARLINHSKNSERYGPLDFTLNQDGSLTCPNRQTTHKFYRSQSADGYNYRFRAAQCQACPLWNRCRGANPETASAADAHASLTPATPINTDSSPKTSQRKAPKADSCRTVFISHYRDQQRAAILYTQTEQFKGDMQFRSTIERIIAALVRYNDARHARSRGLAKADFQVRMAAVAYNLKKWHKLTLDKERAARYQPPDSG